MKSQHKSHKKVKSKSLEKKSLQKKQQLNFLANCDLDFIPKIKGIFADYNQHEGRQARSQQASRSSSRKQQNQIIAPSFRLMLMNTDDYNKQGNLKQKPCKNNYKIHHVIGKGGFGKVWKVQQKKTGLTFAMKQLSKAMILTRKSLDSVINQRELLTQIKHHFIVNMRQAFQDRQNLYLVMDLMTGGDLRYHICKKHKFTQEQARFFTACIFQGLQHLHDSKIIHRDLKPENLVLDQKGYIHITDLGIAKLLRAQNYMDTSGTPGYMAPQVICRQNHSFEVDYYALGVILYELMIGKRPYIGKSRKQIKDQILSKQTVIRKSDIPQGWSIEAADFINKLIQRKPMMRLGWGGAHQVKSHPWLKNFPWSLLQNADIQSPFKIYSKYNASQVRYHETKYDKQMQKILEENKILLRENAVQKMFMGYTFWDENNQLESHTTSSELYRHRKFQDKADEDK